MNRLVAVHAPAAWLGEVLVISVELWTDTVFVHIATDRPGDAVWLNRIPLSLADDAGTTYEPRESSAGGTGTELRGMWRFEPGVPDGAARLTISLGDDSLELTL